MALISGEEKRRNWEAGRNLYIALLFLALLQERRLQGVLEAF